MQKYSAWALLREAFSGQNSPGACQSCSPPAQPPGPPDEGTPPPPRWDAPPYLAPTFRPAAQSQAG